MRVRGHVRPAPGCAPHPDAVALGPANALCTPFSMPPGVNGEAAAAATTCEAVVGPGGRAGACTFDAATRACVATALTAACAAEGALGTCGARAEAGGPLCMAALGCAPVCGACDACVARAAAELAPGAAAALDPGGAGPAGLAEAARALCARAAAPAWGTPLAAGLAGAWWDPACEGVRAAVAADPALAARPAALCGSIPHPAVLGAPACSPACLAGRDVCSVTASPGGAYPGTTDGITVRSVRRVVAPWGAPPPPVLAKQQQASASASAAAAAAAAAGEALLLPLVPPGSPLPPSPACLTDAQCAAIPGATCDTSHSADEPCPHPIAACNATSGASLSLCGGACATFCVSESARATAAAAAAGVCDGPADTSCPGGGACVAAPWCRTVAGCTPDPAALVWADCGGYCAPPGPPTATAATLARDGAALALTLDRAASLLLPGISGSVAAAGAVPVVVPADAFFDGPTLARLGGAGAASLFIARAADPRALVVALPFRATLAPGDAVGFSPRPPWAGPGPPWSPTWAGKPLRRPPSPSSRPASRSPRPRWPPAWPAPPPWAAPAPTPPGRPGATWDGSASRAGVRPPS